MTVDPTRAQIEISAHATGTEEVTALAKEINKVAAAEENLADAQEKVTRQGTAYLAYLKRVQEAEGKTREEQMRLTADRYGVGAQANPMIDDIINQRTAQKHIAAMAAEEAAVRARLEAQRQKILNFGKSPDALFAEQAARFGLGDEATTTATELARLEAQSAAMRAEMHKAADGQTLLASLQQRIDSVGKTAEQLFQEKAAMLGVGEQAAIMAEQLKKAQAETIALAEAAVQAATRDAQAQALLASLQSQINSVGKNPTQLLLEKAAMAGVEDQARSLTEQLAQLQAQDSAMKAEAARVADVEAQRKAFIASLQQELVVRTKTRSEIMEMQAAEYGVLDETRELRRQLVETGIDGEHSFKHMIASGGVFRELLVLIHESLIMGNWSRFGGSMMVLAERTGISASIFTAMGVSVLGAAAAVAALTGAMFEGERQSTAFARAMSLTGGFAGITEGQFNQMAARIGTEIPGSVLKARSALLDLVKTGQFSGNTLAAVGRAATEFSKYSGESAEQSAAYFAQMKNGVADWAAKANETYHFLTVSQYDQIASLERMGQVQMAEALAANDWYEYMAHTATQNLGLIEEAINGVTHAISNMWNGLESIGRKSTLQEQLASLEAQRAQIIAVQAQLNSPAKSAQLELLDPDWKSQRPGLEASSQKEVARLTAQINALNAQINAQNTAGAKTHNQDIINQHGIEAQKYWTAYISPSDPESVAIQAAYTERAYLKAALQDGAIPKNDPRYKDDLNIVSGGSIFQQRLKNIQYDYGRQTGNYGNDKQFNDKRFNDKQFNIPLADTTRLQTQLSIMEQMAKATHQTELATLKLEIAQGKLKGFSPAEIKQLTDMATRHDQFAAALGESNLQNRYADELNDLLMQGSKLRQKLEQLQTTGRVSALSAMQQVGLEYTQGDLVGISPEDIKKLQAAATGVDQRNAMIKAVTHSATFGTQNAFSTYIDQATNAGQQVRQVWSDTFSGMQDMLTRMLEGGKLDFRDFTHSVVDDLLKMEVQENIMSPIVKMLGNLGGGKNGSAYGDIFSALDGGAGDLFRDLVGPSKVMSTAALIAHQGGQSSWLQSAGSWVSSFFADGGIMSSRGSIPLNKYANGGIANTPQMAIFGEGRGPEAYVPLPDGRSIPVTMRGGGGGVMNHVTNHITINSDGSTHVTTQGAKQMAQAITQAVQQELIRQAQDGGMFSPSGSVFRGGAFQR